MRSFSGRLSGFFRISLGVGLSVAGAAGRGTGISRFRPSGTMSLPFSERRKEEVECDGLMTGYFRTTLLSVAANNRFGMAESCFAFTSVAYWDFFRISLRDGPISGGSGWQGSGHFPFPSFGHNVFSSSRTSDGGSGARWINDRVFSDHSFLGGCPHPLWKGRQAHVRLLAALRSRTLPALFLSREQ